MARRAATCYITRRNSGMKILWICGLPYDVQQEALRGEDHGAYAAWSWVLGHLPPPPGVDLHIACRTARHTAPREFSFRGATFHLVPVKARARVFCLFQFDWRYFRDVVVRVQPDVTHAWGTEDAYAQVALRLCPERHLIQVQGNVNAYRRRVPMPWATIFSAWSERLALARARHVVAENDYSLQAALPMVKTKSVHVIEHPIREAFLMAAPSTGEGKQVLFLGAIEERKGIWDALDAFEHGAAPDWKLGIVGNGRADIMARLRQRIAQCGSPARITHHPQLDTAALVALMQASSVFLLPTRIDTGPTALKEALAMGLWPVCYDNSGPAHYLRRFQFGALAEDLNLVALTETLRRALAAQEWKQAMHRAKIASAIRPHFSREPIWQQLARLYALIRGRESG